MKNRLRKKWLAVGAIWTVVVAMTGWNIHLVGQIQSRRMELKTLQMDLRFLKANQTGIQEVNRQQSLLTHPVKSFGLGFMVVENDLKRLSWDFGLQKLRVAGEKKSQDSQSAPISISTTGPVPAIVGWIAAVEETYPYLVIEQMDISYDNRNQVSQLQATFNYHYTLSDPERTG